MRRAVRIRDLSLLRRRAGLQAGAKNVRRPTLPKRRPVLPADHRGVGHHRETRPGMTPLQSLQRRHEGVSLVAVAREQLVSDRKPLRRHQKGEQNLDPVWPAVLAETLERRIVIPLTLEIQGRRVVEDRGQGLREQRLRGIQGPLADRLDPGVVDQVHAAIDVVQVQGQFPVAVKLADRGALREWLGDPGERQFPDDAVGAHAAGAEQMVPAEVGVNHPEGLADLSLPHT